MKFRRIIILLLVCALLSGCSELSEMIDDSAVRELTVAMLDGLIAGDRDACRAVITDQLSDEAFDEGYEQLSAAFEGVTDYELTATNLNVNTTNGVTQTSIRYLLQVGQERCYLDVATVSGVEGLTNFTLSPVEEEEHSETEPKWNAVQWVLFAVGVLDMVFTIWMIVDCCRRKLQKKWLWLLVNLFGMLVLTLTMSASGLNLRFDVGLQLYRTALLIYNTGETVLRFHIPVGGIVYFFRRKAMTQKAPEEDVPPAET